MRKEDIEEIGLMKVDILGLGMFGCLRRAFDLLAEHKHVAMTLDDDALQRDCSKTFAIIQREGEVIPLIADRITTSPGSCAKSATSTCPA